MNWYSIRAKADVSEIWIYDQIGKDWFGDGLTAKEFIIELNAIKSPKIDMHINSPGGECFEGTAIYNAIKRHPAAVTTHIDGIAASIASVIALAGDRIVMAANALYMIHNPSGCTMGTSEDMRKTADILDKVRDTMVGAYTGKSGKPEGEIVALLDAETWMDAEEALAAGFVDEIGDEMDLAACAKFVPVMSKLGFQHIPQSINGKKETPSLKECECALRDIGCSRKVRKSILAKGYSDGLRDSGAPDDPPPVADPPPGVETPKPAKKDRIADLLCRAELVAPST